MFDWWLLFGGYDVLYYFGGDMIVCCVCSECIEYLFVDYLVWIFFVLWGFEVFYVWGGVIDMCMCFSVFWGFSYGGWVVLVLGYIGLGVGVSWFGV